MKVFHFDFRLIDIKILKFDIELAVRMRVCAWSANGSVQFCVGVVLAF